MTGALGVTRALVVGLGVSGVAAAEALLDQGVVVAACDDARTPLLEERAEALAARGASVVLGESPPALLEGAGLAVPSPGVPPEHPLLAGAAARGIPLWSEVELAWRMARSPVIAITGTNGKTTTTSLVAHVLRAAGADAVACGNIGHPMAAAARREPPPGVLVAEVSSFQLALTDSFRPRVAVVLNVADDHYDWHRGRAEYAAAKARIARNQGRRDLLVVRAGDAGCALAARGARSRVHVFGPGTPGEVAAAARADGLVAEAVAGVEGGEAVIRAGGAEETVVRLSDIRLEGVHNRENVLAAGLVAREWGVPPRAIGEAVAGFDPLPHRTTLVAEVRGVRYVDDSKATNPHATLQALAGLERVVLIAGGRAKGLDLSALASGRGRLAGAVVMGEAAGELASVLAGLPLRRAAGVEEAVALASAMAAPGDTVLLSPACSSLDQYASYAERGDRFAAAVRRL